MQLFRSTNKFYILVLGMIFFFIKFIYFFQVLFGLLFPFSLSTSISFFYLDIFPFSLWTFISRFSLYFYFSFISLFPFFFGLLFFLFYAIPVTFWISSKSVLTFTATFFFQNQNTCSFLGLPTDSNSQF